MQGHQNPDPTYGGLVGRAFQSTCPPDIDPRTRIVALCLIGEADAQPSKGLASPRYHGWMYSEFFLFYHLFQGLGAAQAWMSIEDPRSLAERYEQYTHDPGSEDCRVVLDRDLAQEIMRKGNYRAVDAKVIKAQFLENFRSECQLAQQNGQPVLLLLFGNGNHETFGILVGEPPERGGVGERLHVRDIQSSLHELEITLTLMTTSCYSGGWTYSPGLHVSPILPANQPHERLWETLIGRFHASFWATMVAQTLVELEDEVVVQVHPPQSPQNHLSKQFERLEVAVYRALRDELGGSQLSGHVTFTLEEDRWEAEWKPRSGIPLAEFERRWKTLRKTDPAVKNSLDTQAEGNKPSFSVRKGLDESNLGPAILNLCREYNASNPSPSNLACNTSVNGGVASIVKGSNPSLWAFNSLHYTLRFRSEVQALATLYKNILGVEWLDCEDCEAHEWMEKRAYPRAHIRNTWGEKEVRRKQIFQASQGVIMNGGVVMHDGVFPDDIVSRGLLYQKPWHYLAIALAENMSSVAEAEARLAWMTRCKCHSPFQNLWIIRIRWLIRELLSGQRNGHPAAG